MSNRIIKVSILLIFMLFVTGLFNFCFAISYNENRVICSTFPIPEITKANSNYSSLSSSSSIKKALDNYFNNNVGTYPNVDSVLYFKNPDGQYMAFLEQEYDLASGDNICILYSNQIKYSTTQNYQGYGIVFIYDEANSKWIFSEGSKNSYAITLPIEIDYRSTTILANDIKKSIIYYEYTGVPASIKMTVNQTGTKTGHVEFISQNWDGNMYYVKDDMDELVRLIAEEELSVSHSQVKYYDSPIDIEYGEYVLGLLFDENGKLIFSEISDSVTIDYDSLLDTEHKLYIDKENENIYYLSIHNYQDGDYLKVSSIPITSDAFSSYSKTLNNLSATLEYNGLFVGQAYDTALGHKNRKINLSKNGITYFYLYDVNNNLINSAIINSSNYYSGEDFNFDVELQFGSSLADSLHLSSSDIRWVKVIPKIDVPSIDNYELYLRISDYGNIPYVQEEDRQIFATHDTNGNNFIGIDIGTNSNTNWYRIDDKIYDYFYINTLTSDSIFTFELQLRSGSGQIIQTKSFKVNLSSNGKVQGTVSSSTDGKDDTYIRNPNELSNSSLNNSNYDFSGLYDLNQEQLTQNVNGLISNTTGFFSIVTTLLLLLPPWISSLIFLFLTGLIVITLLRFLRGA